MLMKKKNTTGHAPHIQQQASKRSRLYLIKMILIKILAKIYGFKIINYKIGQHFHKIQNKKIFNTVIKSTCLMLNKYLHSKEKNQNNKDKIKTVNKSMWDKFTEFKSQNEGKK